jgi:hypothetical protein
MVAISDWRGGTRQQNLWDRIWFDGEELICDLVVVSDGKVGTKLDVKPRKGEDGADYTDNGLDPATFTVSLGWLTLERASEAEAQLERLDPRAKGAVKQPRTITHPKPNEAGIERVVIDAVSFPKVIKGVRWRELYCTEFRPATPKQKGGAGKPKPGTVGYGDPDADAKSVADYYAAQQREILEDIEAGRIDPDEGGDAFAQTGIDQMNALQDLYDANGAPSSAESIDSNGL